MNQEFGHSAAAAFSRDISVVISRAIDKFHADSYEIMLHSTSHSDYATIP